MARYCAMDDQPVREMIKSDKVWGKESQFGGQLFVHTTQGELGNCGRSTLEEHQTYTEGESDLIPPTEPQY